MKPAAAAHSGTHLVADLYGIAAGRLTDAGVVEALLRQAALAAGATIVYSHLHAFGAGQGVTGVVLLAESHISIHTWPELEYAALDIFMCGRADAMRALAVIEAGLLPQSRRVQSLQRGGEIAAGVAASPDVPSRKVFP